jgi:hypothetical protein
MGVVAVLAATCAGAYPGENITLDPVTGNYIITYWDDSIEDGDGNPTQPELMKTTFVPATKVIPTIQSRFRKYGAENIRYDYSVSNGKDAKQSIVIITLEQVGRIANEQDVRFATATESELEQAIFANMSALDSPANWTGHIRHEQARIYWSADDLKVDGVRAGRSQTGFGFLSLALPGISEARMEGIGAVFGYAGSGPAEDSTILPELNRLQDNDFVPRNAAVPAIAVPNPFDAAVLLDRIQAQMHGWIGMKLLDATFSSLLDRSFQSAISAYRLNQPRVGKQEIQTMRELLKKEQPDLGRDEEHESDNSHEKNDDRKSALIDRLAARVLDFDLEYVTKRMDDDDGEHTSTRQHDR